MNELDLRTAQNVSGRMQRDLHPADIARLTVTFSLQRHTGAEPGPQHVFRLGGRQVILVARCSIARGK